jgi:hypothetical protein
MLVNVWDIPGALVPVLALTAIAVVTKVIGCGVPAVLLGVRPKEAILVGWGMVPLFLMGQDPTLDARLAAVLCGVVAVTLGIYITAPEALRLQVADHSHRTPVEGTE